MKECVQCHIMKDESDFYVIKGKVDYYCKYCRVANSIKSQRIGTKRTNKSCSNCGIEKHYARGMCRNCYTRWHRSGSPDIKIGGNEERVYSNGTTYKEVRAYGLGYRYKVTLEQFNEMSANGCEICGKQRLKTKSLHIDHDHSCCDKAITCGLCVRGILCDACNTAVDKYETNNMRPDYIRRDKVIMYVEKYKKIIEERKNENSKAGL